MLRYAFTVTLSLVAAQCLAADEPFLWIEAEQAAKSQVFHNAWFEAVDPDELSDGKWIASFSEPNQPTGTAECTFEVPRAGEYLFWLRANPRGTGLLYRVDGGPWVPVDVKAMKESDKDNRRTKGYQPQVIGEASISIDAAWDARFVAWLRMGTLDLPAGKHTLAFNLGGNDAEKRFGAVDCFVLTTGQFEPNGKYRPGQEATGLIELPEGSTWAFTPAEDTFDPAAVLDLSGMNEKVAGGYGFIRLSDDGMGFVRGDGQPIRFWGGSTYEQRNAWRRGGGQMEELEHHARFLAKRGVNVVRFHGALPPKEEGSKITDVDQDQLDQVFRLVAAMKKAGIYTIISPYWGSHTDLLASWGVPDAANDNCSALVFFDPKMQEGYKAWLRALYTRPNPYTGIPLAKEPAVAIIQLQNEDSMLFFTMQRVGGQQLLNLRRLYGKWLIDKYGSLRKAMDAWQGYAHEDDDLAGGLPGMFIVWEFTRDARAKKGGPAGREVRLADQLEFMARTMYKFNAEMADYLHDELGCRQLVNAGNWRTADQVVLDDSERWSYMANDVIGKNHYYGGQHKGFQTGWKIDPGHYYTNWSATRRPAALPMNVKQPIGRPFIIPESLWVPPLRYQSEGPLMVAAQTALSGVDTFYWFATGVPEWQEPGNKWTFATPMQLGQFPAAALIFRKALVRQGEPVVVEQRRLQDLWDRKSPIIAEGAAWDPNRDAGDMPVDSAVKVGVDPLAFLVGPVLVNYGGDPAESKVIDLAPYIDPQRRIVRSVTGQIELDYGRGVYRVDAPAAQGAAGFLGQAGPIRLGDVTIRCGNEYATAVVVPLDDRPIGQSQKLLVQVGTVCRPTGWKARPARFLADGQMIDGLRIVETGKPPWQVEKADVSVTVANASLQKATLLDLNGMATDVPVETTRAAGEITVKLPPETIYLVLSSGE